MSGRGRLKLVGPLWSPDAAESSCNNQPALALLLEFLSEPADAGIVLSALADLEVDVLPAAGLAELAADVFEVFQ